MGVLLSTPQPDFSGYYAATGSLGFILMFVGFTTIARQYLVFENPLIYKSSGVIGIAMVLYTLYGLRKDRMYQRQQMKRQRHDRLAESRSDYEKVVGQDPNLPDIASEDEELPESQPTANGGNP